MVPKAFNLSLDELNMTIVGYEDTTQLIPINAYHRLIFCGRILIGVVIDSNEYSTYYSEIEHLHVRFHRVVNCDFITSLTLSIKIRSLVLLGCKQAI